MKIMSSGVVMDHTMEFIILLSLIAPSFPYDVPFFDIIAAASDDGQLDFVSTIPNYTQTEIYHKSYKLQ